MNMRLFFISGLFFISSVLLFSKNKENVLITIEGDDVKETITESEFLRIYEKNNTGNKVNNKPVKEYLDLFVNFKLKVIEAERLGYDTMPSFIKEFENYRDQLAKPYLTDEEKKEEMIKSAYQRMQKEVHASHIMIKVKPDATPDDTLEAYNNALEARKKILNGESFEEVAMDVSDDPSVKRNQGDLGYFPAFRFPYAFEKKAYSMKKGEVSEPVRTRFGYHIIKIHDKRDSRGEVKVAHILKVVPKGFSDEQADSVKQIVDEVYEKIEEGKDFSELAKQYSDDRRSARKGGELPWFSAGNMIPEFEDICFSLDKDGEISEPTKTYIGWHIIKRIDKKDVPGFEEAKKDIEKKVSRGKLKDIIEESFIAKVKKEYGFSKYEDNLNPVYDIVDSSFLQGDKSFKDKKWDDPLFEIGDVVFDQYGFIQYLKSKKNRFQSGKSKPSLFVDQMFQNYLDEMIVDYQDKQLENQYPEFGNLVKEYHDGILLFNIMDDKVWSKAVEDTAGLMAYYQEHKKEYMRDTALDAVVLECANEEMAEDVLKRLNRKKDTGYLQTIDMVCEDYEGEDTILAREKIFEKGEEEWIDELKWGKGVTKIIEKDNKFLIVIKNNVLSPQPKTLKEARGLVISDYQNYLEKEWIKELKDKYTVEINDKLLEKISD